MALVVSVYQLTRRFPQEEQHGLTIEMRRSVVSVPSNIAEGQGCSSTREFQQFLSIAYVSLQEAETQLLIAQRLQYITSAESDTVLSQCSEVGRLINGLSRSLQGNR
jgi:four helix bundle protein